MSILDKVSFEGFRSFVESRDPKETINHSGFDSCAIGLYIKSLATGDNVHSVGEGVWEKVTEGKPRLKKLINQGWKAREEIPTFGKLKRLLNKNYRKLVWQVENYPHTPQGLIHAANEYIECVAHCIKLEKAGK